jgi:hypothetical protein
VFSVPLHWIILADRKHNGAIFCSINRYYFAGNSRFNSLPFHHDWWRLRVLENAVHSNLFCIGG